MSEPYRAPTGYPEDWGLTPARVRVAEGDCRERIKEISDCSVDSVITDPPYSLVSIQKRFGKPGSAPAKEGKDGLYKRASAGFMGKQWDTGETAFDPEFWAEVYRVLKPGAHLIAFSGTRTYHRLACAIEDAGFEIRDQIGWLYGAGFPKSHNASRNLDDVRCRCEPQTECDLRLVRRGDVSPAIHAANERGQVLLSGMSEQDASGAVLRVEPEKGRKGSSKQRVEGRRDLPETARELRERALCAVSAGSSEHGADRRLCDGASAGDGADDRQATPASRVRAPRGSQPAEQCADESGTVAGQSEPQDGGAWPLCTRCGKPIIPDGLGTALKPAWEPIVLARKPLIGTVAANVLEHGTGALNIDGCRVATDGEAFRAPQSDPLKRKGVVGMAMQANGDAERNNAAQRASIERTATLGRWPANVIHDGSEEVVAAFPETHAPGSNGQKNTPNGVTWKLGNKEQHDSYTDAGSAARFFYSAKADAEDRLGSKHPTVKPVDLMAYLCRLVTPPGGLVLDPFAGSGTTGMACLREGFRAILIEREPEYIADIKRRLQHVEGADTPLFGGVA